jgi:hypothetical protein
VKVLSRFLGAMAVQRLAHLTGTIQLKPIDFLGVSLYNHAQSGWLLPGRVIFSRPHNPLVLGSIPSCPTLSHHIVSTIYKVFNSSASIKKSNRSLNFYSHAFFRTGI